MKQRRQERMIQTLNTRQHDVGVYTQGVYNPHNISAVIRSCDAVGVHEFFHSHRNPNPDAYRINIGVTMGANKRLDIQEITDEKTFLSDQQSQGRQIVTTALVDESIDFREVDYTRPTLVCFGNEVTGVTPDIIALSDHVVTIPMLGMVQSLNISVAAAVLLYELQRQRQFAGMYDIPDPKSEAIMQQWIEREMRK